MPRAIQHFEVSIKGLLLREGRMLLVRERVADQFWELPGGRIDVGEELLPAAEVLRRELREELGPDLQVEIGEPLLTWVRPIIPPRRPTSSSSSATAAPIVAERWFSATSTWSTSGSATASGHR